MRILETVDVDLEAVLADNVFDRSVVVRGSGIKMPFIFSSIQDAVDEAESGDTVEVGPGVYEEAINVDLEGLQLLGAQAGVDARNRNSEESVVNAGGGCYKV